MKKKKVMSLAVAGALLAGAFFPSIVPEKRIYAQTESAPMAFMVEKGIFEGDENGNLNESGLITRAEFCKIISVAFSPAKTGEPKNFTDAEGHWAESYIRELSAAGLIQGISETEFSPDSQVTFEQAITIILRAAGKHYDNYPYGYIASALENGVTDHVAAITGEPATRADAAQMLYNLLTNQAFSKAQEDDGAYVSKNSANYYSPSSSGGGGGGGGGGSASVAAKPLPAPSPEMSVADSNAFYPSEAPYFNTEEYDSAPENSFRSPVQSPLSTFSLDVDTASYSNVRRKLLGGSLPEAGVVRTEEMVNYFDYSFTAPETRDVPFAVHTEVAQCPWNKDNLLAMVALKGYEIDKSEAPASNLVFLIDVSGSMFSSNKLPLAQQSMLLLTDTLDEKDRITIVTYAGSSNTVLDTVSGAEKDKIKNAIMSLRAGGSTNGAGGIITAYEKAQSAFIEGGNNRVIICSDGDFNVGITSNTSLEELITEKAKTGVFLSVLGYGMGNYKDSKMETLADCGNGNYAYIDNLKEAKKVLVDDMTSTLFTIAKDVKLQLEFNPNTVSSYRLLGYENRMLNTEDFIDDTKDAGEMGAGHTMIAFYELIPNTDKTVEESTLKYQDVTTNGSDELFTVHLRYKKPDSVTSEAAQDIAVSSVTETPSEDFLFASSVAEFALLLNHSEHKADANIENVISRACSARGEDIFGYRAELIQLTDLAKLLGLK